MLTADHDFQKKEAEFDAQLEEQHRQRYLLIILVIGFFIVSLVIFFSLQGVAKERKRSDQLLHNILPVETAKELKATGKAAAKAHKEVTIVFADVKNFTQIAESLEPQSLVKMLDKYFSGFDQIINQFGIEKIKTIGDAYMFVSGLHVNDNHAIKAVNASMAMLDSVKKLEEDMLNTFGTSFAFRIGIHSGRTISGVVGKIKYAFDIWGDSVNIAARMEAQSEPGRINISDRTHQLVKDSIPCTYRGEMAVKNKGNMAMYFVD
jgi:class 3 adenylate cyclase